MDNMPRTQLVDRWGWGEGGSSSFISYIVMCVPKGFDF